MITPLIPEEVDSPKFVEIRNGLEKLWLQLRRKKPELSKFLIHHNPYERNIFPEMLGLPFDYAEPLFGDLSRKLWNCVWRLSSHKSYDFSSWGLLNSIRVPAPRCWEYPWGFLQIPDFRGLDVLDVGSGLSLFPMYLAKLGAYVTSIDLDSAQMNLLAPFLAKLLEVDSNMRYEVGDATHIDYPSGVFDYVCCVSVLEHIPRGLDVTAIREMLRVLKSNGKLIATVDWSDNPRNQHSYRLQDVLTRLLRPFQSELENRVDWGTYSKSVREMYQTHYPFYGDEELRLNPELDASVLGIVIHK